MLQVPVECWNLKVTIVDPSLFPKSLCRIKQRCHEGMHLLNNTLQIDDGRSIQPSRLGPPNEEAWDCDALTNRAAQNAAGPFALIFWLLLEGFARRLQRDSYAPVRFPTAHQPAPIEGFLLHKIHRRYNPETCPSARHTSFYPSPSQVSARQPS